MMQLFKQILFLVLIGCSTYETFAKAGRHPGFDWQEIMPSDLPLHVGGMDFLPDGRLAVATWDTVGAVYLLDNISEGDANSVTYTRFAFGLHEPLGLKVFDGRIFVVEKQQLTELIDTDDDNKADEYRNIASGWEIVRNWHSFIFGPILKDGKLYLAQAVGVEHGGAASKEQSKDAGTILEIDLETGEHKVYAGGLRVPNGLAIGPEQEMFASDNQGTWRPGSALFHIQPGHFYGHENNPPAPFQSKIPTPPVIWFPQGEISNSPSEPLYIPSGTFAGQMFIGDVTFGGIRRLYLEKVERVWQGALFDFAGDFPAGVNRLSWGPDGSLYLGCIGLRGNWSWKGNRVGLVRGTANFNEVFDVLAVRQMGDDGFRLEFTAAVDTATALDISNYEVKQWRYEPRSKYGGKKLDETDLPVLSVRPGPQKNLLDLKIEGLEENRVIGFEFKNIKSVSEQNLYSDKVWYTLNRIGVADPVGVQNVDHGPQVKNKNQQGIKDIKSLLPLFRDRNATGRIQE